MNIEKLTIKQNEQLRAAMTNKWDKAESTREVFNVLNCQPDMYSHADLVASWDNCEVVQYDDCQPELYSRTSLVASWDNFEVMQRDMSEESIMGDIRFAMLSLLSFPESENMTFWKSHFERCAEIIVRNHPDGKDIADFLLTSLISEAKRLPMTVDFNKLMEGKQEQHQNQIVAAVRVTFIETGELIASTISASDYGYADADEYFDNLWDGFRWENKPEASFEGRSLEHIGFSKDPVEDLGIYVPFGLTAKSAGVPVKQMKK